MRLFIVIFLITSLSCSKEKRNLPIYGRSEIKEINIDGKISFDTINHYIKKFSFYNQDSILIDNSTFNNSIYVACLLYTSDAADE